MSKKIIRKVGKAVHDFGLIDDGDNILVALSGGKDSYTMLDALIELQKRAPVKFKLTGITVESGFDGFKWQKIEEYCKSRNVPYIIKHTTIYDIIEDNIKPNTSFCSFCARLRRGVLYTFAYENGYNKIALGHHGDDFIETVLMNMFYNGQLKAMSPRHVAKDKRNIVIRPLVYVLEREIIPFARKAGFPVICCACPICHTVESKRKVTKKLLTTLEKENPDIRRNMLTSLTNLVPEYFLNKV
jgi:tRNA 2-thiocytidine biosynthesis protein TtcA